MLCIPVYVHVITQSSKDADNCQAELLAAQNSFKASSLQVQTLQGMLKNEQDKCVYDVEQATLKYESAVRECQTAKDAAESVRRMHSDLSAELDRLKETLGEAEDKY